MRFIEQNFPVTAISESCIREKSIRHGHISTLQTWWARRPLAVCRATIFLSLLPEVKSLEKNEEVCKLLDELYPKSLNIEAAILTLTAELSDFGNSQNKRLLAAAKKIIAATNCDPKLIDTFSGGGSIPLESIRLGIDTFASDLNPIAATGLELSLSLAPQISEPAFARLILDIQELDSRIRTATLSYYRDKNVLAYFWARTYCCPSCNKATPLIQNKWLSKKGQQRAVKICINETTGKLVFSVLKPESQAEIEDAEKGTVSGKSATCVFCSYVTSTNIIQEQGTSRGLSEIVYAKYVTTQNGKEYFPINEEQSESEFAFDEWSPSEGFLKDEFDLALDLNGIRHLWAIQYGIRTVGDLFNKRQKRCVDDIAQELKCYRAEIERTSTSEKETLFRYISLIMIFNKIVVYSNRHSWWQSNGAFPANIFVRQAISMIWNYVEIPPCSTGAGGWDSASKWIIRVLEHLREIDGTAHVSVEDAEHTSQPDKSLDLVVIDPPYFDSITYAYLSDFFYPWMKVLLESDFPNWYHGTSTPKTEELIVDRKHKLAPNPKDSEFFRNKMARCLTEATRLLHDDGLAILMYGHKDINAWLALFRAITDAGMRVTTSWPVSTERKSKFKHGKVDALGISCILVLRRYTDVAFRTTIDVLTFQATARERVQAIKYRHPEFEEDQTSLSMSIFPLLLDDYIHHDIVDESGEPLSLEALMKMAAL